MTHRVSLPLVAAAAGVLLVLLSSSGASASTLPQAASGESEFADFRALWVSRFEFNSPARVQKIVSDAASMGITDLLFQVRGKSDAFYNSNIEPRSERLTGTWDPLQTAIDAANTHGIKVHAWINTLPLWRDTPAPQDPSHPFFNTDPSFRVTDLSGQPQDPVALGSIYATANPILPEVHTHINSVVNDIVTNYDVAGVHLDFIRWLGDLSFSNLPHDDLSHQHFQSATGLDASNPANANAYRGFIRDRITDLVGTISQTTRAQPGVELSAAVWRDPDIAFNERLQDYRTWLENDLLDIVMPMIYLSESNNNLFIPNLLNTLNIPTNTRVAPGIGTFLHDDPALTVNQLSTAFNLGADGSTLFSYGSLFNNGQLGVDIRNAVQSFIDSTTQTDDPPIGGEIVLLADFELDEGSFSSSPTFSGSNRGIFNATADRDTAEAFEGSASQRIEIDGSSNGWTLRHLSGVGDPNNNTPLLTDGYIGFWLMTQTPGLSVQIGLDDPASADRGVIQPVIADGQWHLYQWDLDDPAQWEAWVNGNGVIDGPTLTIDSIFFHGFGDAVVYLDAVGFNLGGSLVPGIVGDLNGDGFVGAGDLDVLLGAWNQSVDPGSLADLNGDGFVGAGDLDILLGNWNAGTAPGAADVVPEPQSLALLAGGLGLALRRRRGA